MRATATQGPALPHPQKSRRIANTTMVTVTTFRTHLWPLRICRRTPTSAPRKFPAARAKPMAQSTFPLQAKRANARGVKARIKRHLQGVAPDEVQSAYRGHRQNDETDSRLNEPPVHTNQKEEDGEDPSLPPAGGWATLPRAE